MDRVSNTDYIFTGSIKIIFFFEKATQSNIITLIMACKERSVTSPRLGIPKQRGDVMVKQPLRVIDIAVEPHSRPWIRASILFSSICSHLSITNKINRESEPSSLLRQIRCSGLLSVQWFSIKDAILTSKQDKKMPTLHDVGLFTIYDGYCHVFLGQSENDHLRTKKKKRYQKSREYIWSPNLNWQFVFLKYYASKIERERVEFLYYVYIFIEFIFTSWRHELCLTALNLVNL